MDWRASWYGHEPSIRVPLFIYDPRQDKTRRGKSSTHIALNIDIAPTILSLAGINIPAEMQGIDLMHLVAGKISPRQDFFYEHTYLGSPRIPVVKGVVTTGLKYMIYPEHDYEELFDIANDPLETTNQANNPVYAPRLKELRARYEVLKQEVR